MSTQKPFKIYNFEELEAIIPQKAKERYRTVGKNIVNIYNNKMLINN